MPLHIVSSESNGVLGPAPAARARSLTIVVLLLALGCGGETPSPTDPSSTPALATAATALAFSQLSGGGVHTCGLTTDFRVYCWGYNEDGQLGDGTNTGPESCTGAVGPFACSTRPVPVAGTRQFRQVSAGNLHTCAVTTDFRAYCWGSNSFGELGDGTTTDRTTPVLVRGGLQFRQVDAGSFGHTCGVTYADRRVYCWGYNRFGQLGDGTTTQHLTPIPVLGGHEFRQVTAGDWHTCGVTTSNQPYCWGRDDVGQLGNDPEKRTRLRPVLVAGGYQFRQLDAGSYHTCAVTTDNRAFCWGGGSDGQIGDGKTLARFTPRAVAGGLSFTRVSGGVFHTCGETTNNLAYCWGNNTFGQLGNGGPEGTDQLKPVAVAGGLHFEQVSAGGNHTCGTTSAAVAYCWGYNFFGQLGDGNTAESPIPVPVAGGT
ncbi:MAG: RCC1 domain-containing protein [Gemmatimonadales bacterium]